ncbi:hypothetical protein Dimus_023007 [Dionaea muscipula]
MSKIFKKVTGLYGMTSKNLNAEILGDSSGSFEATPTKSQDVAPVQVVRSEEVATSSAQEKPPIRPNSPKARILRGRP